jgi:GT2 family glycosyltransferase
VIVVNDGSRPEERAALDALAARYPFRILDKENGGQGSARNAGVAASTSEYICFLDQDDFYLPNHIETLVTSIPQDDRLFGYVYADLYEADGDGNVIRTGVVKDHAKHPKRSIFDLLRYDMFVLPSATLVSREAFEAVGGFDSQFMGYEDDDLFMRIFRKGYSNHFVDKAVTVWCIHTASTSFGIRMVRSRFKYFKKLLQMFPDEHQRGRYYLRDYLMPRFQLFFVNEAIEAIKKDDQYRGKWKRSWPSTSASSWRTPTWGASISSVCGSRCSCCATARQGRCALWAPSRGCRASAACGASTRADPGPFARPTHADRAPRACAAGRRPVSGSQLRAPISASSSLARAVDVGRELSYVFGPQMARVLVDRRGIGVRAQAPLFSHSVGIGHPVDHDGAAAQRHLTHAPPHAAASAPATRARSATCGPRSCSRAGFP